MKTSSDPYTINTRSGKRAVRWAAFCLLAATVVGCGRSGLERVIVTGRVTHRNEAIANGEIRFVPTKGTQGPVSGGSIIEGAYTADGLGGVPVGTYLVKIQAFRTPKVAQVDSHGNKFLPREQYLPEKFNTKTKLEITVEPGSGKITKNFDLAE